jgi:hypothetical protein
VRIWKLTPTDLSDPIWQIWSPEPIIVRAESEREARRLAKLETLKSFPARHQPLTENPWGGYKKIEDPAPLPTVCEDVTATSEYSIDGSAAVLSHGEKF